MQTPDTLARIRSHLLALQHEAAASGDAQSNLSLWQERLDRLERALEQIVNPSAPSTTRRVESELRRVIRLYAGYPARFVAYAEMVPEWTVRDVRNAMRLTADHGLPQLKPQTSRDLP